MNITYILIGLLILASIACLISTSMLLYLGKAYKISDYKTIGDGTDLIKILDDRIEEVLSTYIIMNLAYRDSLYISIEMQEKMTDEIYISVTYSLPYDYMNALRIIYNHPLEEIKRRVTLTIMNYVIETNGNYKE